jgi:RNA polymerase sigma factor (sigma-70 family)
VDDTDAADQDIPVTKQRNHSIIPDQRDSVANVSRVEWAACYRAEMPYLVRYLIQCFDKTDVRDAAEAAHSAFAELFEQWDTVHNPRAWLRTVAFRQMLRQPVKAEYPLDIHHRPTAYLSASAEIELREEEQEVLTALRQLPLTQRQVLALIYDNFSYREIARIMDMKEPAVRKNAERAKTKMKEILGTE